MVDQQATGVKVKTKRLNPLHFPGCLFLGSSANDSLSVKGHPFTQALFTFLQFHIWKRDF